MESREEAGGRKWSELGTAMDNDGSLLLGTLESHSQNTPQNCPKEGTIVPSECYPKVAV